MFESSFLNVLMREFWTPNQKKVILKWYLPQLCFIITSIHYLAATLHYNFAETAFKNEFYKQFVIYIQGSFILALSVYLGYRETVNPIFYFKSQAEEELHYTERDMKRQKIHNQDEAMEIIRAKKKRD